ncbi:DUF881 domain-containing protein [uncultured Jatrophihabitans sp.]|uniref:DUF881 domain-containing protein n=1 Tax=uncultured Jatrophihabitans sp. TaxID=1610747 RepID=UPI0035CBA2FB
MSTRGTPPQRTEPARLLVELVSDPVDPGYRQAARRRAERGGGRHWYDQPLVALGCLLIGFVAVVAYVHTHRGAPEEARTHNRLVERVRSAQRNADGLGSQVDTLQRRLAKVRDSALPPGALAAQLGRAQLGAGQTAVHGPGITITLREPKKPSASPSAGRVGSIPIDATHILTDRDVRSVVNELWHDGAEAIEVNGVRLTPTSAIRFAGEAVLVDFQPITAPYRIAAIGNADDLSTSFAQSSVASRYQTLVGVDGIGFSIHDERRIDLPAAAPVNPRYARPAPTAIPSRAKPTTPSTSASSAHHRKTHR